MTAIRSDRLTDGSVPEKPVLEIYAPRRKSPERPADLDQATATAFEGEIREFVRRDIAHQRRQRPEDSAPEPIADNLNGLIRRISGASIEEIDRVILELQGVRDMLLSQGERVGREFVGYASLSHAAMTAMKVIGDSLTQWKSTPHNSGPRPAD